MMDGEAVIVGCGCNFVGVGLGEMGEGLSASTAFAGEQQP